MAIMSENACDPENEKMQETNLKMLCGLNFV